MGGFILQREIPWIQIGQFLPAGDPQERVVSEPAAGKIRGHDPPLPAKHHFAIRCGGAQRTICAGGRNFAAERSFFEHSFTHSLPVY